MVKSYNSNGYNDLDSVFQDRIGMLREFVPNWDEEKDQQETNACLAAQKLSYVDGVDYSEYYNTYNRKNDEITADIRENMSIAAEAFGKDIQIRDLDYDYINEMSEAFRASRKASIRTKHLYKDKAKTNFPEEMFNEYDKIATLRELEEQKHLAPQKPQQLDATQLKLFSDAHFR